MKWINKKKRPLPEEKICRNCGAETHGRYCHECGQDVFAGTEQPIVNLAGEVLENAFALDAKAPKTILYLLFRPGFLSEEYRNGRINRYVSPVKLFWMVTLILFALLISQNNSVTKANSRKSKNIIEVNFDNSIKDTVNTDTGVIEENDSGKRFDTITNSEREKKINEWFIKYLPYVSFLLIPVFALLLMLFFRRAKYYYMYHLMFAVHFHTFLYLFLTLLNLPDLFVAHTVHYPDWCNFLFFITPGIYLTIALRKFYQTKRWRRTMWKAISIILLYLILILIVIVAFALIIAYLLEKNFW